MKNNELLSSVKLSVNNPDVHNFLRLLEMYIDDYKEQLTTAKGDDVLHLQGAIVKIREIIGDVRRKIEVKPFKNGAYTGESPY